MWRSYAISLEVPILSRAKHFHHIRNASPSTSTIHAAATNACSHRHHQTHSTKHLGFLLCGRCPPHCTCSHAQCNHSLAIRYLLPGAAYCVPHFLFNDDTGLVSGGFFPSVCNYAAATYGMGEVGIFTALFIYSKAAAIPHPPTRPAPFHSTLHRTPPHSLRHAYSTSPKSTQPRTTQPKFNRPPPSPPPAHTLPPNAILLPADNKGNGPHISGLRGLGTTEIDSRVHSGSRKHVAAFLWIF